MLIANELRKPVFKNILRNITKIFNLPFSLFRIHIWKKLAIKSYCDDRKRKYLFPYRPSSSNDSAYTDFISISIRIGRKIRLEIKLYYMLRHEVKIFTRVAFYYYIAFCKLLV